MDDRLLTGDQLADYLSVTPETLAGWRRSGEGPPCLLVGGGIRYRESAVEAWLATRERDAVLQQRVETRARRGGA